MKMFCPKCDFTLMEPMGSGDYVCPECDFIYFCTWDDLEEEEDNL